MPVTETIEPFPHQDLKRPHWPMETHECQVGYHANGLPGLVVMTEALPSGGRRSPLDLASSVVTPKCSKFRLSIMRPSCGSNSVTRRAGDGTQLDHRDHLIRTPD